jgi:TadE-like protein
MNAKIEQTSPSLVIKNQRGNTTTEMAMMLLPFVVLIMGVMEFGWYFLHQHTLQYATREGMRLALVGEVLNDENGDPQTRDASIRQVIHEKGEIGLMNIDKANDIAIWKAGANDDEEGGLSFDELAPNAGNPADYMRLKVQYEHHFLTPLVGKFFPDSESITLRAEATYRNEDFTVGGV